MEAPGVIKSSSSSSALRVGVHSFYLGVHVSLDLQEGYRQRKEMLKFPCPLPLLLALLLLISLCHFYLDF